MDRMTGMAVLAGKVEAGACVVASISLGQDGLKWPQGLLSEEELSGLSRFRHEADRRRHAHGRGLARSLLGVLCGQRPAEVPLKVDAQGKPHVEGSQLTFSIAHSGDAVLVACARNGAVGVDVESLERRVKLIELARHFFHVSEVSYIEAIEASRRERFFQIWTAKEAYCKALGLGLGLSLSSFNVEPLGPFEGRVAAESGERRIVWFRPFSGYAAALCCDAAVRPMVLAECRLMGESGSDFEVRAIRTLPESGRADPVTVALA